MGKKLFMMMVGLLFITFVSGCQEKGAVKSGNSVDIINTQLSETIKNTGSNGISKTNNASITKVRSVSKDEFVSYFVLTKEEILRKLGPDYRVIDTGPDASYEGYQYRDMGLDFVFESDNKVGFIICSAKVEINGARAGMNFVQIQEKLGEAKIEDTWYDVPEHKAYKISYIVDNCVLRFMSFEKDGSDSRLTVYRKRQPLAQTQLTLAIKSSESCTEKDKGETQPPDQANTKSERPDNQKNEGMPPLLASVSGPVEPQEVVVVSKGQVEPPDPYVYKNCPVPYGEKIWPKWRVTREIVLRQDKDLKSPVISRVIPGDIVQVAGSELRAHSVKLLVTKDYTSHEGRSFFKGDVLYVLYRVEEDFYRVWHNGMEFYLNLTHVKGSAYYRPQYAERAWGEMQSDGNKQNELWVELINQNGQRGWTDLDQLSITWVR